MKKKISALTFTTLFIAANFSAAHAMKGHKGHGQCNFDEDYNYPCCQNLTDQEILNLKKEKSKFLNTTRTLRTQIFQAQMSLEEELTKDKPDYSEVKILRSRLYELNLKMDGLRSKYRAKINQIVPGFTHYPGFHNNHRGNGGCRGYIRNSW